MTTANASASNAGSLTSSDVLATLDSLLDRTPHDAYICAPLKRSTVAAIAAEIRRLRVQLAMREQRETL